MGIKIGQTITMQDNSQFTITAITKKKNDIVITLKPHNSKTKRYNTLYSRFIELINLNMIII